MKVKQDAYVGISYTLKNDDGETVDSTDAQSPLGFVFGRNQIIPGLEAAIEGMQEGESIHTTISPEQGYGELKDEFFQKIPRSNFPADGDITKGQQFQANTPHGPMRFVVHDVEDENIVVNLNHPLAGETLHFDVTIALVRDATEEELTPHGNCDGNHDCSSCGGHSS